MLDAAAQEHWAQHGWLWLRGFLGSAEVEDLFVQLVGPAGDGDGGPRGRRPSK